MTNRQRDIICAVLFLAFGVFMYGNSVSIDPIITGEVGSGYVPRVVGLVIGSLSAILLVVSVMNKKLGKDKKSDEDVKAGVFTIMALVAYVALFQILGFIVSTVMYLFIQIMLLSDERNRRPFLFGLISVVAPVIIYVLFKFLFQMALPSGILGV